MATAHADCEHESTKSARERCRRLRYAEAAQQGAEPEPVTVIQVNPGIWKTALELAGGKASRIRVISATQVEVT